MLLCAIALDQAFLQLDECECKLQNWGRLDGFDMFSAIPSRQHGTLTDSKNSGKALGRWLLENLPAPAFLLKLAQPASVVIQPSAWRYLHLNAQHNIALESAEGKAEAVLAPSSAQPAAAMPAQSMPEPPLPGPGFQVCCSVPCWMEGTNM